jgi:hypothetical protein
MYPLGTWFVSGICVWIPCIKEMTMMMMMMMIIIIIINYKITTKDSYTWNMTHNTESTGPEGWGSLLVQEKYQEGKACDKRRR